MPGSDLNTGKTFVIGDIHGANKALLQCLERSAFNNETDILICLGDVYDGWPEIYQSVETLLLIKNLVYIMGNHDFWALHWMKTGECSEIWYNQGGDSTLGSYDNNIPASHINLLLNARYYYIYDNNCFVHAGIDPDLPLEKQEKEYLIWSRDLVNNAMNKQFSGGSNKRVSTFKNVFVGHTPTLNFNSIKPIKVCEVWMMDTGAGWHGGVLSMMDIKNETVYQSDPVEKLYPNNSGRMKF